MPTISELERNYLLAALGSSAMPGDTLADLRAKFYAAPPLQVGTGSPEGVVTATPGTQYIDTAQTNGASQWVKKTGTGNTGWRVSVGDTGRRVLNDAFGNPVYLKRNVDTVTIFSTTVAVTQATHNNVVMITLPAGFTPANASWTHNPVFGIASGTPISLYRKQATITWAYIPAS